MILGLVFGLAMPSWAQEVLPHPPQPFKGKIGRTAKESTPDFPQGITAPKGAQSGTYAVKNGGSTSSDFNVLGPTDAKMSDVDDAVNAYFGSIGSGETKTFALPAPLVAGFSETMPVGATGYVVVDLKSGRYLMAGNTDDNNNTIVSDDRLVSGSDGSNSARRVRIFR